MMMGKRQGTKNENKQLWGRVAMAAALWYCAPIPRPYLVFVASDVHGPNLTPDAHVVKHMLVERFQISADFIIVRQRTNCTLLEVRAMRAIKRAYKISHVFALTHLYHAPRAQRYLDEVLKDDASVIPVHPEILAELEPPPEGQEFFAELHHLIAASQPSKFDLMREYLVEWLLNLAHTLDRRGRFERRLAHILRPGAYP
jgi:hypothetical protein